MRIFSSSAVLLALGSGCGGGTPYTYSGFRISEYFPLDGTRTWEYAQDDETDTSRLSVEKIPETVQDGSTEIVTLEYSEKGGDLLYAVDWSSESGSGVLIHGYRDERTGASVSYDPPVTFGERDMVTGDVVETETNEGTFTSTLEAKTACPNLWRDDWECLQFTLDDGDGDDDAGPPFAGSWWIATSYGASRFIPTGYTTPWLLASATFSAEE